MPPGWVRAVVLAGFCALVSSPAGGDTGEAEIGLSEHAWYHTGVLAGRDKDGCPVTALCEAAPPGNPYPAGTLHVGTVGGRESARTYLRLDRSAVPAGAVRLDGVLHLPIADASAGTFRPDAATMDACLAVAPFTTIEAGQPSDAPAVDCATTVAAAFEGNRFTLQLGPFLAAWAAGIPDHGLALLAREEAGATWHVAFPGEQRPSGEASAERMTARVRFDVPTAEQPPAAAPPDDGGSGPAASLDSLARRSTITAVAEPQPVLAPPILAAPIPEAAGSLPSSRAPALVAGASYPAVWVLPLLLVATGAALARSFTAEMRVRDVGPRMPSAG